VPNVAGNGGSTRGVASYNRALEIIAGAKNKAASCGLKRNKMQSRKLRKLLNNTKYTVHLYWWNGEVKSVWLYERELAALKSIDINGRIAQQTQSSPFCGRKKGKV
jgi:hypothetical protein